MAKRKKRAVAYVRVSTASKAQLHSYEFQAEYWQTKFDNDPDVELVGIYADRGISGTSVYKRPQFMVMMQDARAGKFDVIYTKSVSRFARNTLQLLEAVRELRDIGVEVIFEKEQISTLQPTSELFMTIAATVAENDLKVDSERQRWSIQHRCENGWISIGSGMYGYTMDKENNMHIVPEEAAVVRRIFDMYVMGGATGNMIAQTLNREGILNSRGKKWKSNVVLELISNEKYMGDAMMGKTVRVDGVKRSNLDGQYGARYYTEGSHEGIVSREVYEKAQEIRQKRKNPKKVGNTRPVFPFGGMIKCGVCGGNFNHKINNSGKPWQSEVWVCGTQIRDGVGKCNCSRIKDSVLREKFLQAYNEFVTERPQGESVDSLQRQMEALQAEEVDLATLRLQRLIPEAAFRAEQRRIKDQLVTLRNAIADMKGKFVKDSDYTPIWEFDVEKVNKFISKVIVLNSTVTFEFYNGVRITKEYDNGPAGNQTGWKTKREARAWR